MTCDSLEHVVRAAFPRACRDHAGSAAVLIGPRLADRSRIRTIGVVLAGEEVHVPWRLNLRGVATTASARDASAQMALCLRTRSADGYERQAAAAAIAEEPRPFVAPCLLLLAADHVAAVARVAAGALTTVPEASWRSMALENRPLLRDMRAAIARRHGGRALTGPSPGFAMLRAIERLATA